MIKYPKIQFLFLFFCLNGFAQYNTSIDGLVARHHQNPKDKETISELAQAYMPINPDSAIFFARKLLTITKKNEPTFLSRAYTVLGHVNYLNNKLDSALFYHQKAIDVAKISKNEYALGVNLSNLAQVYMTKGNMRKSIESYLESEQILLKHKNNEKSDYYLSTLYSGLGEAYKYLTLYDKSLSYLYKSLNFSKKLKDDTNIAISLSTIAAVYCDMKDYSKSELYYKNALIYLNKVDYKLAKAITYFNLSEINFEKNEIAKTIKYLDSSLQFYNASNNNYQIGNVFNLWGKVNLKEKNFDKAFENFSIGLKYNQELNSTTDIGNSFESLGDYYKVKKLDEKALMYYQKALIIFEKENLLKEKKEILEKILGISTVNKNSNLLDEYLISYQKTNSEFLNAEKQKAIVSQEVLYETELKEAKIKTQELELLKEKDKRLHLIYAIGMLLTIGFLGLYGFLNRQRKNQLRTKNTILNLQNNLNKMELQNLNQQLNPHEFKNLLVGIAPEIQQKAPEAYKNMIRLLNITKEGIKTDSLTESVENQLLHLESVLQLEQNIATYPFDWNIVNKLNIDNCQIPRLIIKNAVDNAIKHGIKNKVNGKIEIELSNDLDYIYISINDNAEGNKVVSNPADGIGISTYKKLFETLNSKNKNSAAYNVFFKDKGTEVTISIPIHYKYN